MTLTKSDLEHLLFENVGLNKREAKEMVASFFDEILKALEDGQCVKLAGFGNFVLREKGERPGRNPKTGQQLPISARRVATFHASQLLQQQVASKGNKNEEQRSIPMAPNKTVLAVYTKALHSLEAVSDKAS